MIVQEIQYRPNSTNHETFTDKTTDKHDEVGEHTCTAKEDN
jgi:hypothetical protein